MSETELVRIFGVPTRTFERAGHTFLAYDEQYMVALPPEPVAQPFRGWWLGGGQPAAVERACETTIEIAGGKAVSWSLHGDGCG
jgi:hypothetical protein